MYDGTPAGFVLSVYMNDTNPLQKRLIVLFVLFAVAASMVSVAPAIAQDEHIEWAERISAAADSARVTGVSIAVIRDGNVEWSFNRGVRSAVTSPVITSETVFEAGALGKPVLAYIVLQLADQGKIDLDTPLVEYARYADLAHDPRVDLITARMVLMHATGLPNWRSSGGELSLDVDPGLIFSYSGEGFVMLQRIVEQIVFRRLDALADEMVFQPLGMTSSSYEWRPEFSENIAVGHDEFGSALDKFTPTTGTAAFTLHTTASDYARFAVALARGDGLERETVRDALSAQIDAGDGISWGLGWGLQPTAGGPAIWQWGDNLGYKSFVWVAPGAEKGFVYLSNSNDGMLILHEVFDIVVGGEQTAVRWLDYERYNDPKFVLGRMMSDAMIDSGIQEGLDVYERARSELSPAAYVELTLNNLGYRLLRMEMIDEAIAVFELNTREYPDAYNTHDSLGEAYFNAGMLEAALRSYQRSLELNPGNQSAYEMIRLIEEEQKKAEL